MKRLMIRKIREALRLHASGLSTRKIATSLGVGQSTASEYLKRIERATLTWPLSAEMTDVELEALLFHPVGGATCVWDWRKPSASRDMIVTLMAGAALDWP